LENKDFNSYADYASFLEAMERGEEPDAGDRPHDDAAGTAEGSPQRPRQD
jgi:hypothetical protein